MATIKPLSVSAKRLAATISGSATSFKLDNILTWDGVTNLVAGDFGTKAYAAFRNSAGTLVEFMEIDPSTIASASITILYRGLAYNGDNLTTEISANKLTWVKGDTIVELGTHLPQLLAHYVDIVGAQTIAGVKTFTSFPVKSGTTTPTAAGELATKAYVDLVGTGTAVYDQQIISATVGENVVAGNLVYFKTSDGKWWKTDADTAATVDGVKLGFAQGTILADAVGNILISGLEKNQSGLTGGTTYYASNTAGGLSSSAGTTERVVGKALSTTTFLLDPDFAVRPTALEKLAFGGSNGTLSATNKLLTQLGLQRGQEIYGLDAVGTDSYAITLSPVPVAYVTGMVVNFKAGTANTGAATLNVNSLGAITIKKLKDQDLATGDIESGQVVTVVYDGTNFQMQSQIAQVPGSLIVATASDTQITAADTVRSTASTTFVKQKSIQVAVPGVVRVKHEAKADAAGDSTTQIYINGTIYDLGGSHLNSTTSYVAYSDDVYVSAGDRVELWQKTTGAATSTCKNFRICFDTAVSSTYSTVITD